MIQEAEVKKRSKLKKVLHEVPIRDPENPVARETAHSQGCQWGNLPVSQASPDWDLSRAKGRLKSFLVGF